MVRVWNENSPDLWIRAVQGILPEPLKFALNASLNTLPTNANLHTWGKKSSDICPLCQQSCQFLSHVLNNCLAAMDLWHYSVTARGMVRSSRSWETSLELVYCHTSSSPLMPLQLPIASPVTSPQQVCDQTLSGGVRI